MVSGDQDLGVKSRPVSGPRLFERNKGCLFERVVCASHLCASDALVDVRNIGKAMQGKVHAGAGSMDGAEEDAGRGSGSSGDNSGGEGGPAKRTRSMGGGEVGGGGSAAKRARMEFLDSFR